MRTIYQVTESSSGLTLREYVNKAVAEQARHSFERLYQRPYHITVYVASSKTRLSSLARFTDGVDFYAARRRIQSNGTVVDRIKRTINTYTRTDRGITNKTAVY